MARVAKAKRKPTREQIRAWLATVLSPMLRALDVELSFVSQSNWTFRCESQDFEYLWPTAMMVGFPHRANAEQVFRYYPSLHGKTARHDSALVALLQRCQAAYRQVLASSRFPELPIPTGARADDRRYFAEYVVNGIRNLPSHYSFADFWIQHGHEYLDLRTDPALRPSFETLDAAGGVFKGEVVALRQDVKPLQESLADEAGLPPVPDFSERRRTAHTAHGQRSGS